MADMDADKEARRLEELIKRHQAGLAAAQSALSHIQK